MCSCFLRRLGRNAPHFLELANSAVRFVPPRERLYKPQSNGEIRWRDREHVPQPIFVPANGGAIALPRLELGECVQHVSISCSVPAQALEHRARVGRPSRKRIEAREREPHFGTRGV